MNDPAMHIPEETSDQSSASEGAALETASQSNPIRMRKRPHDLTDLLSRITDDNREHLVKAAFQSA